MQSENYTICDDLGGLGYKYHMKYRDEIGIHPKTEAYIQSLVLKKTLESISFDRRRGIEEEDGHEEAEEVVNKIDVTILERDSGVSHEQK